MADEILFSGLADVRLAEVLENEILLLLADRESFFNHPAIVFLGDAAGQGSTVSKVGLGGWDGYDEMAAVAENATTSNTAFTDASQTVTIARQALQYQMSDLARTVDATGQINPGRFAMSMAGSANMRLTSMITALTDSFSSTVGSTTVDLTLDDFFDAIFTLELASVPGPFMWDPHPRQYADFQNSLRSELGAVQFLPATAEQLAIRGPGFKGSFAGCDIVVSSKVPTANAGADRASGMWGRGAIGYKVASVPADPNVPAIYAGPVMIEFERDAGYAYTKIVGNLYCGTIEIQDSMGVSVITDA